MPLICFIIAFWVSAFGMAAAQVIPTPTPPNVVPIISGSQPATGTAAALPSVAFKVGPTFTARGTNTGLICLGASNVAVVAGACSNGYTLQNGQSISYSASQMPNISAASIAGTNPGDVLEWTGN